MRVWLVSRCVYRWDIFLHKRTAGIRLRCWVWRAISRYALFSSSWYNIASRIETMVLAPIFLRLIVYRFSLPLPFPNVKILLENIMAGGFEIREQKLENFFLFLNFLEKKKYCFARNARNLVWKRYIYYMYIYIGVICTHFFIIYCQYIPTA